jgi:hypothetical protein
MPCRGPPAPAAPEPVDGVPLALVLFLELLLPASDRFVDNMTPELFRTALPTSLDVDVASVRLRAAAADACAMVPLVPAPAPTVDRAMLLDVPMKDAVMDLSPFPPAPPLLFCPRRASTGTECEPSSHGCGAEMNTEPGQQGTGSHAQRSQRDGGHWWCR